MRRHLLPVLAWLLLLAVAFVTLAPIGLRPETGTSPNFERFAAFALVSFAFALAYPRRLGLVILVIAGAAVGLELMQMLVATRHARVLDMSVKLVGGGVGLVVGMALTWLWSRRPAGRRDGS